MMSIIEIRGVVKTFGPITAVAGVDMDIAGGECLGLLGPNGAGKTSLVRILSGELRPTSGRFLIDDTDACYLGQRELARHFSVIPQEIQPPPHLTVLELVTLGRFHPCGALWRRLTEQDRAIVQAGLVRCQIDRLSKRRVEELSGGEQRRAWLAFGLAQKKGFLPLDETLDGLDLPAKRSFFRLLKELAAEGRGVLLTTHDLDLVTEFADRVVAMAGGSLKYEGPPVVDIEPLLCQEGPSL
jgi:ABC-type cobalamin/Fe3+-siderophores transport system ATPase subunit